MELSQQEKLERPDGTKPHILYLEDDQAWVDEVRTELADCFIEHASTIETALAMAEVGVIDVALVDLGLLGKDHAGLRVVWELRSRFPQMSIIVLTGKTSDESFSVQSGADAFIQKTNLRQQLRSVTRRLLQGQGRSLSVGTRLTSLMLVDFKGWQKRHELPLGGLTLLLGANSSGKSSLLHALLLLKQTAESADRSLPLQVGGAHARHLDLGTFEDIVFGHSTDREMSLGLTWQEAGRREPLQFETTISAARGALRTLRFEYRYGREQYGMAWTGSDYRVFTEGGEGRHESSTMRSPLKCYGFPPDVLGKVPPHAAETLRSLQLSFELLMEGLYYLGPLRERPAREYVWTGERPASVGARGDRAVEALLALDRDADALSLTAHPERKAVEVVAAYLQDLELAQSFRLHQITPRQFEVRLVTGASGVEVGLADVGFGISQVLPILVLGLYAPAGSIVLIEQPELHLHPAAQMGLGDVLLEIARQRQIQLIVETHSEHLLSRLQRRVAEGHLSPEEVRLYFCRKRPDGSEAEALRLDALGHIANWPPSFFGDPLAESAARVRAALQRQASTRPGLQS